MAPTLYYAPHSPPSHLVLLIAKHLNIELDLKLTIPHGDGITSEFLKVNPAHQIPVLDDDGFYLPESNAIAIYLLEKHDQADTLIPKDVKLKALVNHRLFFDVGLLWPRSYAIMRQILRQDQIPDEVTLKSLEEGLQFLDAFIDGRKWLVGDNITLADYSILTTVSFIETLPLVDLNKHTNVAAWYELAKKSVKGYDEIIGQIILSRKKLLLDKYTEIKSKLSS